MDRVYNFSAGPSVLPLPVLEKAQKELLNFGNTGMSVMEMSHRSKVYDEIIKNTEKNLREIMNIPNNYKVLFIQGGASLQFSMIPLNLFYNYKKADFINTGVWSKKAIKEAKKYGKVNVVASSEDDNFSYIPKNQSFSDADYVHITSNNTIYGTRFNEFPKTGEIPLVADMSSEILSREINVADFGLIYAGAQKNMGPAGLCVVIIREDLIGNADENIPVMLDYKTYAENDSMYNTPPTYPIYITGLVFEWIKNMGGIKEIEKINIEKAKILYDFLDDSDFYNGTANKDDRSLMNVPFTLPDDDKTALFLKQAEENGLVNLKGHRSVGGARASIYNAMPIEGVKKLVDFMKSFEINNK